MEFECIVTSTDLPLIITQTMDTTFNEPLMMLFCGLPSADIAITSSFSQTIHCSKNKSGVINTNITQKDRNTNHSWFIKPMFDNILKSIKLV